MVHGVRLGEGRARWYRNRWVDTDTAADALQRPRAPGPRHGLVDVVNTNVFAHAGSIWAAVESGPLPVALDGELNTVRHGLFNSDRRLGFTAHPHRDPATGELHAICYDALHRDRVFYQVIDTDGELAHSAAIPVRDGPMIHDCAITEHHVVVFDLPVTFSPKRLMRGAKFPYAWNPRHPARVGLLPRYGNADAVRWFDVDPCFVFHACNAFETPGGEVVVDVITHERMFDRSQQGPEDQDVAFERWRLGGDRRTVAREPRCDRVQEFPRFDERRAGGDYRYAYTVGLALMQGERQAPLIRHDLESGRSATHDFGPDTISGEAIFVPAAADAAEDDGWLLSYVYNAREGTSQLVILNARDFEGEPQAIIALPTRVPLGFHANWIPDAA